MATLKLRFDENALEAALESGEVNETDAAGATPLWNAAYFGSADLTRRLLEAGATIDGHERKKLNAVRKGISTPIWTGLPGSANMKTIGDNTLLHTASGHAGDPDVAEMLINAGVDVNGRDKFGDTALHIAAFSGHEALTERLLAKGADPNVVDAAGYAPIDHALDKPEVVKLLLAGGADPNGGPKISWYGKSYEWSSVTSAAASGHHQVLKMLLDAGADLAQHPNALGFAARQGHAPAVRRLLKNGADVDYASPWKGGSQIALEAAAMYASMDCVEALVPDCLHQLDSALAVAIQFASEDGTKSAKSTGPERRQVIAHLISVGADANKGLPAAAALPEARYVKLLLEAGADVDAVGPDGRTALHTASHLGLHKTAKALLAAGADPNKTTTDGRTPWELAKDAHDNERRYDARIIMQALDAVGAAPMRTEPEPPEGPVEGATVHHAKFGQGVITAIKSGGEKVVVEFEESGTKTMLMRFLK